MPSRLREQGVSAGRVKHGTVLDGGLLPLIVAEGERQAPNWCWCDGDLMTMMA
jgi:hypothetical protein